MKENLKNQKGITIIALIITIIVTLILATIVIKSGTNEIKKANLEDLKTTMLLIKGRAQISIDKANFEENYVETGVIKLNTDITLPANASQTYNLSNLNSTLNALDDKTNLYIWEQTAMNNNGIDVEITAEEFYVIDYNTMEIYYSLGYTEEENTYYTLTSIQEL